VRLWVGVSVVSLTGCADTIVQCFDVIGVSLGPEHLGLKSGNYKYEREQDLMFSWGWDVRFARGTPSAIYGISILTRDLIN